MASTASRPDPASDIAPRQLLLFRLGDRIGGIELEIVREILPPSPATRLPGAPSYVRGLINVRGTVITVIDLVARLAGRAARPDGPVMLIEHQNRLIGVAVDEVIEVQPLPPDGWQTPIGDLLPGGIVYAMGEIDSQTVLLLDIRAMLTNVLV
ncbi:MAG TPA: chemotaxis protein CheW [Gemmatimonadaceae bacterium]|nr:chemotaxis protein CheW [Gemmatimonadaceae bacterium]